MQDRQHIDNDPTLVDRGWMQMQAQLDEVMPVRKRRFFPWWILLMLGLIGSLGAYNWVSSYEKSPLNKIEAKGTPASHLQETLPIAQVGSNEELINNVAPKSTAIPSSPRTGTNDSKELTALAINTNVKDTKELFSEKIPVLKETTAFNTPVFDEEKIEKPSDVAIEESLKDSFLFEDEKNEKNTLGAKPIASLETIVFPLLEERTISIENEISNKSSKKSHLIIQAGAEIGFSGNPQAGSLGLAYQHSTNENFSYELGLNYQEVSVSLLSDALGGSERENLFVEGVGLAPNLQSYSISQAYDQLKIGKINVDFSIRKKISSRWSLLGGGQISYFTKASLLVSNLSAADIYEEILDYKQDLYDEPLSVYTFDSISNRIGEPYQLEPNRWQFSALLGAHYKVSKRWELAVTYRKTLTKWPDNKNIYGANSFVGLELRYYLW